MPRSALRSPISVEDYVIVHIEQTTPSLAPDTLLTGFAQPLAHSSGRKPWNCQNRKSTTPSASASRSVRDDVAIIDWNATLIYGRNMEDVVGGDRVRQRGAA